MPESTDLKGPRSFGVLGRQPSLVLKGWSLGVPGELKGHLSLGTRLRAVVLQRHLGAVKRMTAKVPRG